MFYYNRTKVNILYYYNRTNQEHYMNPEFRTLRVEQLERALHPFLAAKETPRPQKGWIRAIREASGVTVREMARRLRRAPSVAAHLEGSEAEYRITLGRLRDAADA